MKRASSYLADFGSFAGSSHFIPDDDASVSSVSPQFNLEMNINRTPRKNSTQPTFLPSAPDKTREHPLTLDKTRELPPHLHNNLNTARESSSPSNPHTCNPVPIPYTDNNLMLSNRLQLQNLFQLIPRLHFLQTIGILKLNAKRSYDF